MIIYTCPEELSDCDVRFLAEASEAGGPILAEPKAGKLTMYFPPFVPNLAIAVGVVSTTVVRVVFDCGHLAPDWRESVEEVEEIFIRNNVEAVFVFT